MQQQSVGDLIDKYGGDVLVVPGRPRYHLDRCRHVADRVTETADVRDAREDGYTACGVCRPDVTLLQEADVQAASEAAAAAAPRAGQSIPSPRQGVDASTISFSRGAPTAAVTTAGHPAAAPPASAGSPQAQRPLLAILADGRPVVRPQQVPAGMPQPLGELPDGSPVWPVPRGSVPLGAPTPFGLTSQGAPVWAVPGAPTATRPDRPAWKKKRVLVPAGLVALLVFGSLAGGGDQTTEVRNAGGDAPASAEVAAPVDPAEAAAEQAAAEQAAADKAAEDQAAADKAAADKAAADAAAAEQAAADKAAAAAAAQAAAETAGQKNASRSAESYLDMAAFSRSGLIKQLEFEGYSTADATYGVDAQNADWNAQAARSAESYLEMTAFSRSGLIDQLKFEGYTGEQAEYGVSQAGL